MGCLFCRQADSHIVLKRKKFHEALQEIKGIEQWEAYSAGKWGSDTVLKRKQVHESSQEIKRAEQQEVCFAAKWGSDTVLKRKHFHESFQEIKGIEQCDACSAGKWGSDTVFKHKQFDGYFQEIKGIEHWEACFAGKWGSDTVLKRKQALQAVQEIQQALTRGPAYKDTPPPIARSRLAAHAPLTQLLQQQQVRRQPTYLSQVGQMLPMGQRRSVKAVPIADILLDEDLSSKNFEQCSGKLCWKDQCIKVACLWTNPPWTCQRSMSVNMMA